MSKKIISGMTLFFLLSPFAYTADVDENTTELQNLRTRIGNVQSPITGLPSGVTEPKGTIGYILSRMFNDEQQIPNVVLKAFDGTTRNNNNILKWSGGNGGSFAQSNIFDNGITVGVGAVADGVGLGLDVVGNVGANQYCDGNGNNCFSPSLVSLSGSTVGGSGTAGYVTRFLDANTIGDSVMQDDGNSVGIGVAPGSDRLRVNGIARIDGGITVDGRAAISGNNATHTARYTDDTRYGFFEVRNDSNQRGAYFGWGNGGNTVNLTLESANLLNIAGGQVQLSSEGTAANHLVTKGYVDAGISSSNLWQVNGNTARYTTGAETTSVGFPGITHNVNTSGGWARNLTFSSNNSVRGHFGAYGNNNTLNYLYMDARGSSTPYSGSQLVLRPSGNVGIGETNPSANLHVSGGVGDAELRITADTNNSGENDNPRIYLEQDGGAVDLAVGMVGSNGQIYTDSLSNASYMSASSSLQLATDGVSRLTVESGGDIGIGTSTPTQKLDVRGIIRQTMNGTYDLWIQGGADNASPFDNRNLAILGQDENSGDRLYINHVGEYSGGTMIGGNGENEFGVGNGLVTGNYGSVQTYGNGKGGYEGYSINGRAVFMHNGNNATGIYNDVNNEWLFYGVHNGETRMYHNGTWRLRTHASGIQLGSATMIDNVSCIGNCF